MKCNSKDQTNIEYNQNVSVKVSIILKKEIFSSIDKYWKKFIGNFITEKGY